MHLALFLAGAALASAVAMPSPGGGDFAPDGYYYPGEFCSQGPDVSAEWGLARQGIARLSAKRPPVRKAAGMYPDIAMGGASGDFEHRGCANGVTLRTLEVWGEHSIDGIRLTFYDGEQFAAGDPSGCYNRQDFEPNEFLTYLEQASSGGFERSLKFKTSAGKTFEFSREVQLVARSAVDLHSGFICGISGNDAEGLGELDFLFAPRAEVVSIVIDPRPSPSPDNLHIAENRVVLNNINIDDYARTSYRFLYTRDFKYRSNSNLGFRAPTSVEVIENNSDRDAAMTGEPFRRPSVMFKETREFNLDSFGETLELRIPARHECKVDVIERVVETHAAPWTGTETYLLEDGDTFSLRITGTVSGTEVIERTMERRCFPIKDNLHSWHFDNGGHDWADHCVGFECGDDDNNCCGDLECINGICQSGVLLPPVPPDPKLLHPQHVHDWLRHCAGAPCENSNFCCGDLVCDPVYKICVSPFPHLVPANCETEAECGRHR